MQHATHSRVRQVLEATSQMHPQCDVLRQKIEHASHAAYNRSTDPAFHRQTDALVMMVENILDEGIAGGIMETGVWTGFNAMVLSAVLDIHGVKDRDEWWCDSFDGLPKPDASRFPADHGSKFWKISRHYMGASPATTQQNFAAVGVLKNQDRQHWEVGCSGRRNL